MSRDLKMGRKPWGDLRREFQAEKYKYKGPEGTEDLVKLEQWHEGRM